jgi:DNA adenine methylase
MSYQGGKVKIGKRIYKVLKNLEEYFEEDKLDYLEPFVGFCGVMRHFGFEGGRQLNGSDANKDVIAMWQATQKGWEPPTTCTKEKYESLKNSKLISAERGFIGVACSYSGIFFVGYRGTQTFKNGGKNKTVDSAAMTARSVNKISKMVKHVFFKAGNYQNIIPKNMLIYCDPPYLSNKYQQSQFFHFDHEEFWDLMRKWSEDNLIVISEYNAPKDFKAIWSSKLAVSHNGKTNVKIEKLFVHESLYKEMSSELKIDLKII